MDIRLRNRTLICLVAVGLVLLTVTFLSMTALRVGAEVAVADLSGSSIMVDRAEAPQGEKLKYTVVISNSGDSLSDIASGVMFTNAIPANTELVDDIVWPNDSGVIIQSQSYTNNVITWAGSIGSGFQATLEYTVLISDSAAVSSTIANSAEITYDAITTTLSMSTTTFVLAEPESSTIYMPIISLAGSPPALSVNSISEAGNSFKWTVSWQLEDVATNPRFLIQESNTSDFSTILDERTQSDFSELFTRAPSTKNVYYYRARLISGAGSPWSQPVEVINAYADNFSDVSTGWKIVRQDLDDTANGVIYRPNDGVLLVDTGGRWDYTVASPLQPAVDGDYKIETRVQFAGPGNLNTYGIILGADWNGDDCPTLPYRNNSSREASFLDETGEVNPLLSNAAVAETPVFDNCFNHYYRIIMLWNGHPNDMQLQVKKIRFHENVKNSGRGPEFVSFIPVRVSSGDTNGNNEWTVEVRRSGNFKVFSGNNQVAEWNDTEFVDDSYWGFWSSTDEYPGSDPLFDYVVVEPLD